MKCEIRGSQLPVSRSVISADLQNSDWGRKGRFVGVVESIGCSGRSEVTARQSVGLAELLTHTGEYYDLGHQRLSVELRFCGASLRRLADNERNNEPPKLQNPARIARKKNEKN